MDKFKPKVIQVAHFLYDKTHGNGFYPNIYSIYPIHVISCFYENQDSLPHNVKLSYTTLTSKEELDVLECYIHLMKGGD